MPRKKKKAHIHGIIDKLVEAADKVVDYKIKTAFGVEQGDDWIYWDKDMMEQILNLVKPLIQDAQQTKALGIKSSNDIIKLLSKGKISPEEAHEMLKLIKEQVTLEEQEIKLGLQKSLLNSMEGEEDDG